ncbi:MAG: S9 family peptidase [Fimbriimonas ginsengisoli]|uniref:S9 family peptidase n=1 Tax=Fimbriimonas ginsengisoli TaxID=1005039 RepID=A0A931LQK3_FIMGI|nr:S9 family peptidase [Fimbriimonas ginsengisoli]
MPKRPMKPEDLMSFVFVGDPRISPDGAHILFARKHFGDKNKMLTNLWSVDMAGALRQWTSGESDGQGRWSPDGSRIAFVSNRDKPIAQIFAISTRGGEAVKLSKLPEGSIGDMKWSPDGRWLAFVFRETDHNWTEKASKEREEKGLSTPPRVLTDVWYRLDGDGYFLMQRYALYVIDAKTGKHKQVFTPGRFDMMSFDWSPDSRELAVACSAAKNPFAEPTNEQIFRVTLDGTSTMLKGLPRGSKSSVRWSPDGKGIAYVGHEDDEGWGCLNQRLYAVSADGGTPTCLTDKQDYCLSVGTLSDTKEASFDATVEWALDSKSLLVQIGWHGEVHLGRVDAAKGGIELLTDGRRHIGVGNLSADGSKIPCTFGDATHLPEVGWLDVKGKAAKLHELTLINKAALAGLLIAEPEELWLDSTDGVKVQTWVMKPVGYKTPNRYPSILEVHGGPHAQYGWAFFHEFQALAAAGYVVVYSNPRGSKGYGEEFCTAIKGAWGKKDWEDVQAVTHWMQHQPFVDAGRLGVMGGSYGGYMTNWAVGHTRAFKAAITDRSVSNLVTQGGNSDFPMRPDDYWKGCSWGNLDRIKNLWEQSPICHFEGVSTPMLIIHSEGDLRCNVEQGEEVFTALCQQNVEARFVRYPASTFHGLSRTGPPDLRMHRLGEILAWWGKHLD